MVAFKQDWTVKIMERIRIEKLNRNSDISSTKSILEIFTKIHNDNFENKIGNKYFLNIFSDLQYEIYILKYIDSEKYEYISGYIIFYDTIEAIDLFEIAIDVNMQNKGLGKRILSESIELLFSEEKYRNRSKEEKKVMLEVREDNYNAVKLYEKTGFKQISLRKNYYGQNRHGKIMIKKINLEKENQENR